MASIHSQVEQYDKIEEVTFNILDWDKNIEDDTEGYAWIDPYMIEIIIIIGNGLIILFGEVGQIGIVIQFHQMAGKYCGLMKLDFNNKLTWFDGNCDNKHKRFLCNRFQTAFSCNDYIGINTDDDNSFTAIEADEYCQTHYGSHLASIHSDLENEDIVFIIDEIVGYDTTWIGLVSNSGSASWYWRDGCNYDYKNFESGSVQHQQKVDMNVVNLHMIQIHHGFMIHVVLIIFIMIIQMYILLHLFVIVLKKNILQIHLLVLIFIQQLKHHNYIHGMKRKHVHIVLIHAYGGHLASILTSEQNNETQSIFQAFDKIMLAIGFNDQKQKVHWNGLMVVVQLI